MCRTYGYDLFLRFVTYVVVLETDVEVRLSWC